MICSDVRVFEGRVFNEKGGFDNMDLSKVLSFVAPQMSPSVLDAALRAAEIAAKATPNPLDDVVVGALRWAYDKWLKGKV